MNSRIGKVRASLLAILFCVLGSYALAQEPTVIRDYGGKSMVQDPNRYRLVGTTSHQVIVERYELIDTEQRDELIENIIEDIEYYLDQVMEIEEGSMLVRRPQEQILLDLESIVEHKIQLYNYQVDESFDGFSADFLAKVDNIERLNWSPKKVDQGGRRYDTQQMAMNYVQGQIRELKDISARDLRSYAMVHVHELHSRKFDPELSFDPNELDTAEWQVNTPLSALDFHVSALDYQDIELPINPGLESTPIPQGTDEKIVQLLESNNALIQSFSEQMLRMQEEMLALRIDNNQNREEMSAMRGDINTLKLAIEEIRENNDAALSQPGLRPVSTASNAVVRFEKNSDALSLTYQMELNRVYHQLMLAPDKKVMITGFADLSGTPELNADISRRRALNVKRYLRNKGVQSNRMIVNFVGAQGSMSENAADRRVEIAWLGN